MDVKNSKQRGADLCLALGMLAVGGAVYWEASKLPPAPFDPLGPKSFPIWISVGLAALSLVMIVRVLLGRSVGRSETSLILGIGDSPPADYGLRPGLAAFASVLTVLYVAVLTHTGLGFMSATIGYVAILGWAMTDRSPRNTAIAVILAIVSGVAIANLFTKVFLVDLP